MDSNRPDKKFELSLFKNHDFIIAVDEVGVGCLAGPVVAGAIIVSKEDVLRMYENIPAKDSKLISAKQREKVFNLLKESKYKYCTAAVGSKKLDNIGIRPATYLAMSKCIEKLILKHQPQNPLIIVDGPKTIPSLSYPQLAIVRGDRKTISIASASIVAKVSRDLDMDKYSKIYKGYGFEIHKGYGTLIHRKAISTLGACPIHRQSFTLIRNK